jgi:hypothetical protein
MSSEVLPRVLRNMDKDRLRGYASALAFYKGDQWPGSRRRSERRLVLNYARVLVEKVTSYVMGGMRLEVSPVAGEGGKVSDEARAGALAAEGALQVVAAENGLERLDYETEVETAVLGDGAFKVVWDPEDGRVVVTAPDVQGLFVWWHPHDRRRAVRVAERYLIEPEEAAKYEVKVSKPVEAVEDWTAATVDLWVGERLVQTSANEAGAVPYVVFPNLPVPKSHWGVSDLEGFREVAVEVNRAFTQLSRIMEVSGNPITVLAGVEESADIAVAPGAVWELPAESKAYLLDLLAQGGVKVQLEFVDQLYRALHDLAEAPRTAFGDNQRSLSGVALEIELKPLEQKVLRKRLVRGGAYARRGQMILEVLDRETGTAYAGAGAVSVGWGLVAPVDPNADVQRERNRVEGGLSSRRSSMLRLGSDDPDGEWERWLLEQGAASEAAAVAAPVVGS